MSHPNLWKRVLPVLLIAVFALAGCGKKGPLYLPDKPRPPAQDEAAS
jgi:predicted small lipoprotein YifL